MGMSAQQLLQNDPEYLRRQLAAQEMQRLNPSGDAAGAIGALFGRGIGNVASNRGFFDIGDAGLRRVSEVQRILNSVPFDPTNPAAYYESIASALQQSGYGELVPEALKQAAAARTQAEELSLKGRQVAVQEEDVGLKRSKIEQGEIVPNLVTKKGDVIVQKQGKMYVQTIDDEGTVTLDPYRKSKHGAFETKSEYAAAQAASGGVVRQPIVNPRTGWTIGYIILDRQGNEIRRETFDGRPMGTGDAAAPQGGAAVPNMFQAEAARLLKERTAKGNQ